VHDGAPTTSITPVVVDRQVFGFSHIHFWRLGNSSCESPIEYAYISGPMQIYIVIERLEPCQVFHLFIHIDIFLYIYIYILFIYIFIGL